MLVGAEEVAILDQFDADVVIVGAGAVGLLMAVDMAKKGARVILLEAGSANVTKESQRYFESAKAVGKYPLEGLHLGRFRALGGTTHFWGGQLVPFSPLVFSDRPWLGANMAWPVTREDLDPYYDRAFQLCEMENVKRDDDSIVDSLGMDVGDLPININFFFTRWTPESNFARLFQREIKQLDNLLVVIDAPVTALVSDNLGSEIKAVRIKTPVGDRAVSGRSIVLANGTVEIARLLKLNLSDGRKPSWADGPWLGKGFMDHVDCVVGEVKPINKKRFHSLFDNVVLGKFKYQPKLKLSELGQADLELLAVACHFIFRSSISENLANAKIFFKGLLQGRLNGKLSELPSRLATVVAVGLPMVFRYLRYRRIYNPADQGIQLRLTCEQLMCPRSAVKMSESIDPLGVPTVTVEWVVDDNVMKTIKSYSLIVKEYLEKNKIANVHLDDRVASGDVGFLDSIDDANHHMGMARMGSSIDDGVVDKNLRVFGTSNLFVAGAAVYPSSGFENPTFTAMALGLRLGDHLLGAKKCSSSH